VWNLDGSLLGAFLMYTYERHRWKARERDLFSAVTWTLAALVARLVAEDDAIRALGVAVESRDPEVKGHIDRVTEVAARVGQELELDEATLSAIRRGAYLHDLGKVGTPDAILHKPGRLDDEERRVMQQHAEAGHYVARQLAFLPQAALDIVLYHHERWDGAGYPYGLAGEAIPLTARIFALCDVYDALTSLRPYKAAWSHEEAVAEIREQAGKQFDPQVVRVFLELLGGGYYP
jgi:putative nucleotidyltransferase with HDIG domain